MRIVIRFLLFALLVGAPISSLRAQGFATIFLQAPGATPVPALSDAAGRLYVLVDPSGLATAATLYTSAALEGSKAYITPSLVLSGIVVTTSTTPGYLMVWNQGSVPADGAVTPGLCLYIPSSPSSVGYALNFKGSVGLAVAFSTTGCFIKTVSATATFMIWTVPLI